MRKSKTILSIALSLAVAMAMLPGTALAAGKATEEVKVNFSAGVPGEFDMVDETLTVKGDLAEKYFPEIKDNEPEGVSFADALVAAHVEKYGADKVASHLTIENGGWGTSVIQQFGHNSCGLYYVNNKALKKNVSDPISDKAFLFAGACDDNWDLIVGHFTKRSYKAVAGKQCAVKLVVTTTDMEMNTFPIGADKQSNVIWHEVNKKTGKLIKVNHTTDGKQNGKIKFNTPGVKYISVTGKGDAGYGPNSICGPIAKVTVGLDKASITKKTAGKKKATLKWKKVVGAKSYQVYRATKKNGKFKKVATVKKLSYRNKKLKSKKNYYYKVRAYAKADGKAYTGAFSKVVKVKAK